MVDPVGGGRSCSTPSERGESAGDGASVRGWVEEEKGNAGRREEGCKYSGRRGRGGKAPTTCGWEKEVEIEVNETKDGGKKTTHLRFRRYADFTSKSDAG